MIEHDDRLFTLVRLGGPRPAVPPDRAARVRAAVHAAWREQNRRRTRRRAVGGAGLLAAAAIVVLAVRLAPSDEAVAPPRSIIGSVSAHGSPDAPLVAGEILTANAGPVSLRLDAGAGIRMARDTSMRVITPTEIDLLAGVLYVDSGPAARGLVIRTSFGDVRDIGTRFEVRLLEDGVRVRVRDGQVELQRRNERRAAHAGTALTARAGAAMASEAIAISGPEWSWVSALAPPFDIDGRTLGDYLDYLSREHGWIMRFDDPELRARMRRTTLRGSIAGLSPADGLAVALRTSGLDHRMDGDTVVIGEAGT